MHVFDMTLRIAASMGRGALIGFERQVRSRMAGPRTNALVAMGFALFVLLSAQGFDGNGDPTRVAAQVVSSISFLGTGVIIRDGLSVRGINTATTLWCAAAVGSLAGAGLHVVAAAGTVAIIAVNVGLRELGRAVDRKEEA